MSTTSIKATIKVELAPWRAPNYARRVSETEENEGAISVRELDDDTLEDMALAWINDLYQKAGRRRAPFQKTPRIAPEFDRG